jgi:hypothetical protein
VKLNKIMYEEINRYWADHFAQSPPDAIYLTRPYKHLWFRIHTVRVQYPPANEDELTIIFNRHNTLCSDLFDQREIFLLLTERAYSEKPASPEYINRKKFPIAYMTSIRMCELFPEVGYRKDSRLDIWACPIRWAPGKLDDLFRKIAEWRVYNLFLVDIHTDHVYCPNGEGANIFLSSAEERNGYKAKYQDWLPVSKVKAMRILSITRPGTMKKEIIRSVQPIKAVITQRPDGLYKVNYFIWVMCTDRGWTEDNWRYYLTSSITETVKSAEEMAVIGMRNQLLTTKERKKNLGLDF